MPTDFAGELLRVVDAAVIILVVGATATVVRLHWSAWRRCPAHIGLTPLHVAAVSAGVLVWGVALAWAMLDSLGSPVSASVAWRYALYGLGALLILASLFVMASIQRRRVRFSRGEEHQVVIVRRVTDEVDVRSDEADRSPHLDDEAGE